ncbi:MAG: hypothetical protein KY439_00110 [Actinobacteria bacterium]|nr:hypothetical protein [Actinomycetota bacterium]
MRIGTRRDQIGLGATMVVGVLAFASAASACVATTDETKLKIRDAVTGAEVRSAKAGMALRATGENIERLWPYQIKLFVDLNRSDGDQGYYNGTGDQRRRCGDTGIPQVVAQTTPVYPTQPHLLWSYKFDVPFVLDPGPIPGQAHFCANPAWNKDAGEIAQFVDNYVYSPFDVYVL